VNDWVHQQTNGKIKDFLPHGVLNSGTKLALINAIYFNGAWKHEFDKEKTFHGPFYALGDREHKTEVNMMSKTSKHKYYFDQENGCHILELPYTGDELSMIILLPEELGGISRLEKSLTIENLDRWMTLMINTTVSVALPRFKLSQQVELKSVLPKLGIKDLFDARKADLSGISETSGLFVSHVIHKADVEVNERGSEAAAATGVVMMKRSLDMNEVFHADHPFIFLIHHHLSGSILFAGKLMQPSGLSENESDLPQRPVADEL
jgi:serpin B